MSRNPEIEGILEAWFRLDHCPEAEKAKSKASLNRLLDPVVARSGDAVTRDQILSYLYPQYRDYRRQKWRLEQVSVAQSAMKK
jgi:hypothetical protein